MIGESTHTPSKKERNCIVHPSYCLNSEVSITLFFSHVVQQYESTTVQKAPIKVATMENTEISATYVRKPLCVITKSYKRHLLGRSNVKQ